jgi:hypothetical protein
MEVRAQDFRLRAPSYSPARWPQWIKGECIANGHCHELPARPHEESASLDAPKVARAVAFAPLFLSHCVTQERRIA